MVQKIINALGLLLVMAAFAIPVNAQLADEPELREKPRAETETEQDKVTVHQVAGTVVRDKTVEVRGQDIEHQVVLLQTEADDYVIADLGPVENLQEMDVQQGRQLTLAGILGRVSDRPVIFANQVSADGKTIEIDRPELARPGIEPRGMDFSRSMEVTGEIVAEKSVDVENVADKNKVVLLERERGDSIVADLGPEGGLDDMALDTGEQVRVEGRLAQIGERLVLLANKVGTRDESVEINRLIPQE